MSVYYRVEKGKVNPTRHEGTLSNDGIVFALDGVLGILNQEVFKHKSDAKKEAQKQLAAAIYYHSTKAAEYAKELKHGHQTK